MREILFKAKRKDNGEWIDGDFTHTEDGRVGIEYTHKFFGSGTKSRITMLVDPETVCQCTNLKDKNGKKIWENDIVKINKHFLTGTFKVVFNKSAFEYRELKEKYSLNAITFDEVNHYVNANECVEIIGNIFDNP